MPATAMSPTALDGRAVLPMGRKRVVEALLDPGLEIPSDVEVRMPGTPLAVRVTVTRDGAKRRPEVNRAGVALVRRWNRRRSLLPREDGDFTLLDDLRRQFMANEDEDGEKTARHLPRKSTKLDMPTTDEELRARRSPTKKRSSGQVG